MRMKCIFMLCLCAILWAAAPAQATVTDLSYVIEGFVERQFPGAQSHFWVLNSTQWQTENEVVVDLNTVVVGGSSQSPTESRFLLLIVEGKLAASQNIPLDANTDCQPEHA